MRPHGIKKPGKLCYVIERDPDDSKYVNLAVFSKARYLITRDRDLLELRREDTPEAQSLRSVAPDLRILAPEELPQNP